MKPWSTEKADKVFSDLVLAHDPMCRRCKRDRSTDCSHFYERQHSNTRYNVMNADGLCRGCHDCFHANRSEYKDWKRQQLGGRAYLDLQRMSGVVVPREDAIIRFMRTQGEKI